MQSDTLQSSLIQLMTTRDLQDSHSENYQELKFINNELNIIKNFDSIIPLFIKSYNKIDYLKLKIGDNIEFTYDLDFCNIITDFNSEENYIYKLPWNFLNMKPLPISFFRGKVIFKIFSNVNCKAELYIFTKSYRNEIRSRMLSKNFKFMVREYQHKSCTINSLENEIKLNFKGFINGIFLKDVFYDSIKSFKLLLGGYLKINYNKTMINLFCKKFENNCIYIPFNSQEFYDESYKASIRFDRLLDVSIKIKSDIPQKIKIIVLSHNEFLVNYGEPTLIFNFPNDIM